MVPYMVHKVCYHFIITEKEIDRMTVEMRKDLTPQQYIRQLYSETEDGKVSIEYNAFLDGPYTLTYEMDWTQEEAEQLVLRYEHLAYMLERIGKHKADPQRCDQPLDGEEQAVWDTYLEPFDPFEVEDEEIDTLYFRRESDSLDEEENELLERHYEWFQRNSLQRLPFRKCPPAFLINRAQRYAECVKIGAPEVILREEGRWLAEELVLYWHGPERFAHYKED